MDARTIRATDAPAVRLAVDKLPPWCMMDAIQETRWSAHMSTARLDQFIERQRARAQAAEELRRIDDSFPGLLDEYVTYRSEPAPEEGGHDGEGDTSSEIDPDLAGKRADEAAAVILEREGRPMRTPEIVTMLRAAGFGEGYSDLRNAVHVAMGRKSETFVRDDEGAWTLK